LTAVVQQGWAPQGAPSSGTPRGTKNLDGKGSKLIGAQLSKHGQDAWLARATMGSSPLPSRFCSARRTTRWWAPAAAHPCRTTAVTCRAARIDENERFAAEAVEICSTTPPTSSAATPASKALPPAPNLERPAVVVSDGRQIPRHCAP